MQGHDCVVQIRVSAEGISNACAIFSLCHSFRSLISSCLIDLGSSAHLRSIFIKYRTEVSFTDFFTGLSPKLHVCLLQRNSIERQAFALFEETTLQTSAQQDATDLCILLFCLLSDRGINQIIRVGEAAPHLFAHLCCHVGDCIRSNSIATQKTGRTRNSCWLQWNTIVRILALLATLDAEDCWCFVCGSAFCARAMHRRAWPPFPSLHQSHWQAFFDAIQPYLPCVEFYLGHSARETRRDAEIVGTEIVQELRNDQSFGNGAVTSSILRFNCNRLDKVYSITVEFCGVSLE